MNESARLELLRRAWRAGAPSDDEVEAGIRRVTLSMKHNKAREPARRMVMLLAAALAFIAAFAWGASGGPHGGEAGFGARAGPQKLRMGIATTRAERHDAIRDLAAERERSEREQAELAARDREVSRETAPSAPSPTTAGAESPAATTSGSESEQAASTAGGAGAQRRPGATEKNAGVRSRLPTWSEVSEALEAGDDARARGALRALARGGADSTTRAKALVGLAQLAVARGDCDKATALALSVARTPGLDEKLVGRAHDIALRCQPH